MRRRPGRGIDAAPRAARAAGAVPRRRSRSQTSHQATDVSPARRGSRSGERGSNYAGLMPDDAVMPGRDGLLASARVRDLSDDKGDAVARLLADLGADVLKMEPPGGSPSRSERLTLGGIGVRFT